MRKRETEGERELEGWRGDGGGGLAWQSKPRSLRTVEDWEEDF